jgi:DNA-binding beta-propeller fold protein YncE
MVMNPDSGVVYITLQDQREIVAVDPQLQVVNRIKLNASQPTGLVYDGRTKCLYVAVRYAVLSINTDSGTEVNRVPAAAGVDSLWLDPESRMIYAASSGALLMLHADGQRLSVADEIAADVKGHTVAYDPEKKMVVLPGGREGRSKLLLLRPMVVNPAVPATTTAQAKAQ